MWVLLAVRRTSDLQEMVEEAQKLGKERLTGKPEVIVVNRHSHQLPRTAILR
jgi:hypothetical protein